MPSRDDTPKAIRHNDFDTLTLPDACSTAFEPAFNANVADDIQTAIAYHRRRIVSGGHQESFDEDCLLNSGRPCHSHKSSVKDTINGTALWPKRGSIIRFRTSKSSSRKTCRPIQKKWSVVSAIDQSSNGRTLTRSGISLSPSCTQTRLLLDDGLAFLMKTLNSQPIFSRQCGVSPQTAISR